MKKCQLIISTCFFLGISTVYAQDANNIENTFRGLNLQELAFRFAINFAAILILVRVIYFARHRNKDFLFTYILFNSINFLICFLLSDANLGVGFAFGLFAIFSIMRYRTVTLPVKEMGYLFLSVALGLLNALATIQEHYVILLAANAFVLLLALVLDRTTSITFSHEESKQIEKNTKKINKIMEQINHTLPMALSSSAQSEPNTQKIIYERIDLIKPELRADMIADLQTRTGLPVYAVDILSIDLMHDVAEVKAHYHNDVPMNMTLNGNTTQLTPHY